MGEICHVMSRDVTLLTCRQKIIVKVNIMGEILSHDVTLLTCQQKIIVKVNIMGEILSRDVTLLTCRPKIIVKVNISEYYGFDHIKINILNPRNDFDLVIYN